MKNVVVEILRKSGPCLSSDLSKKIVSKLKINKDASRQRISRALKQSKIKQLAYLTFPSRVRFIYLEEQYFSPLYWKSLNSALIESSSVYGLAYSAIEARGGLIPFEHFISACGSPVRQKKHIAAETVLKNLILADVVEVKTNRGLGKYIVLREITDQNDDEFLAQLFSESKARILVESILLEAVKDWLKKLGLVSYNKVMIRGKTLPKVSTFAWDLTAPSYLKPFTEWDKTKNKPKPGFVTCDVLLNNEINKHSIVPFISKCLMINSMKKNVRFFHILVASKYTPNAFKIIKETGLIVPATPSNLFGHEISEGLKILAEVLSEAASISLDLDKFEKLFSILGKIEGATGNLRGALFELFSAELTRFAYHARPELNVICKADGKEAEIDVLAEVKYKSVHFIECKGYKPTSTISIEEIKKWLNERIPTIRKWALSEGHWGNDVELHFELWITGKLNPKSLKLIEKAISDTKKYKIVFRNSENILKLTKKTGNKALVKVLKEHFLNHPLASL